VVEARVGSTIDGRHYSRADFFKEIEAYHRAVVVAHQAHSKITVSLPLPPDSGYGTAADGSPWSSPVTAALPTVPLPNGAHGVDQSAATPGYAMPAPQPAPPVAPPAAPEATAPQPPPAPPEAEAERDPEPPHSEWRRPKD
jgi:hypothetical protein